MRTKPGKNSTGHVNIVDATDADQLTTPANSPSELDRKTRECETARKLIEVMRAHRQQDQETITALRADYEYAKAEIDSISQARKSLEDQLRTLTESTADSSLVIKCLEAREQSLIQAAAISESEVALKSGALAQELQEEKELRSSLQASVSGLETEKKQLLASLTTLQNDYDDLLSKYATDMNEKAATLSKSKAEVSCLLDENKAISMTLSKEKSHHASLEKQIAELREARVQAERRARSAERNETKLQEEVAQLRIDVSVSDKYTADLREEIENLLLQQTQAIEKVSDANIKTAIANKSASDANCKAKQLTFELLQVNKDLKLKVSEVEKLVLARETLEAAHHKEIISTRSRGFRNALLTAVVTFLIARVLFAILM